MKHLALAAALALSACATSPFAPESTPVTLSASQMETIQASVQSGLLDPESARFGNMAAALTPRGTVACGYVNAKNTFGGYTGNQVFRGRLDATGFEVWGIDDSFSRDECLWFGVQI